MRVEGSLGVEAWESPEPAQQVEGGETTKGTGSEELETQEEVLKGWSSGDQQRRNTVAGWASRASSTKGLT